ncbi:N-gene1 [Hyposoter didymator ichnovirus]|nr:N-gene1 [Hyposoter didymator ichnovirus]
MAVSDKITMDISQEKKACDHANERPISPSFLRALGLMKITTEESTVTSVPLSKSCGTGYDKSARGSRTSASKEPISLHRKQKQFKSDAASSAAKKTSAVKQNHVPKPKDRAKKRSRATSFDKPQNIPAAVSGKKVRKPAAPATDTDEPTIKKKATDVKKKPHQQHKRSRPATKVSSSAPKPTDMTAENLSDLTNAADKFRFWSNVLGSDFKSDIFVTYLKNNEFTEVQVQAIQKSFQCLYRSYCRKPIIRQRSMKTYECVACNFSVSHECVYMKSSEYWTFGGIAPRAEFITPESTTMCSCNFTVFHSHCDKSKSKRQAECLESSPLSSTLPLVINNRSMNFDCPRCCMKVLITHREKEVCSKLMEFISADNPAQKKFFNYINNHLDYSPKELPILPEFYSCSNLCCMIFHRCAKDFVVRNAVPIQPHRPINGCTAGA